MTDPAPKSMAPGQLERIRWTYASPRFGALSHHFRVRTDDVDLGRHLTELLGALVTSGGPDSWYSVLYPLGPTDRCAVYYGTERVILASDAGEALASLLHHANRSAIESSPNDLVIHAAAGERRGRALLFPAPTGSGKSTLIAGLVRAGLRYLTDEAAALDLDSLDVRPYPKPICIKPGAQPFLTELKPAQQAGGTPWDRDWWVPAARIRLGSLASAAPPSFVIGPHYEAGASTSLTSMGGAEAVMVLAANSFNLTAHGSAGLAALARVVERSACFRLVVGDLGAACRLVLDLLTTAGTGRLVPPDEVV